MARTVHRLYNVEAQKILDQKQVTLAHWYYLRVLAERGEINQLELSKRVGIASTTAVPALDNMEKRGLLKRTRDPKDRRKFYVGLTEDGKSIIDELLPEIIDMMSASLEGITREEMRCLESHAPHRKKPSQDVQRRSGVGLTERVTRRPRRGDATEREPFEVRAFAWPSLIGGRLSFAKASSRCAGARAGLRPVEMNGPGRFHLVIVLLTRFITSAKFAPKASAVFRSPGFISSTEASEGETATRPTKPPR